MNNSPYREAPGLGGRLKLDFHLKAYSGYVVCERGIPIKTASDLLVAPSAKSEELSLVLSAGPDCKWGVMPGDLIAYQNGQRFLHTKGPNGGELFSVPENMITLVQPVDGTFPRNTMAKTTSVATVANVTLDQLKKMYPRAFDGVRGEEFT